MSSDLQAALVPDVPTILQTIHKQRLAVLIAGIQHLGAALFGVIVAHLQGLVAQFLAQLGVVQRLWPRMAGAFQTEGNQENEGGNTGSEVFSL